MGEKGMTVNDGLKAAYRELAQIAIPAELTFSIGIHVGKTLMILKDCIDACEQEKQVKKEEPQEEIPDVEGVFEGEGNDA